jgi:hypothetical protein
MNEKKMGGICGTYRGEKKLIGFGWEELKEREHFEDLRVDGSTILISVLKK